MTELFGIKRSIFRQLLVSFFVVILLSLLLTSIITSHIIGKSFEWQQQRDALRTARWINSALQESHMFQSQERQDVIEFFSNLLEIRIWILDRDGSIVNTSSGEAPVISEAVQEDLAARLSRGEVVYRQDLIDELSPPLSVGIPMGVGDTIEGGIIVHTPVQSRVAMTNVRESLLWVALAVLLAATALGSYLAWTICDPLKSLTRFATEIAHGNFEQRIEIESRDEIRDLASAINQMARRIKSMEQEKETFQTAHQNFMASASHELRSPLTTIKGYAEALQDDVVQDPETRGSYLGKIHQQCSLMEDLVRDLLELNRLEADQVKVTPRPIQLWMIIEDVVDQYKSRAHQNETRIYTDLAEDLPPVLADEVRLRQVFLNLVDNAVKFTENGVIRIEARQDNNELTVTVADTGTGIAEYDLDHIWQRLYRGANSRHTEGAGLGLAIVWRLVQLQDGSIDVDSTEGEGTTFRLQLPIA